MVLAELTLQSISLSLIFLPTFAASKKDSKILVRCGNATQTPLPPVTRKPPTPATDFSGSSDQTGLGPTTLPPSSSNSRSNGTGNANETPIPDESKDSVADLRDRTEPDENVSDETETEEPQVRGNQGPHGREGQRTTESQGGSQMPEESISPDNMFPTVPPNIPFSQITSRNGVTASKNDNTHLQDPDHRNPGERSSTQFVIVDKRGETDESGGLNEQPNQMPVPFVFPDPSEVREDEAFDESSDSNTQINLLSEKSLGNMRNENFPAKPTEDAPSSYPAEPTEEASVENNPHQPTTDGRSTDDSTKSQQDVFPVLVHPAFDFLPDDESSRGEDRFTPEVAHVDPTSAQDFGPQDTRDTVADNENDNYQHKELDYDPNQTQTVDQEEPVLYENENTQNNEYFGDIDSNQDNLAEIRDPYENTGNVYIGSDVQQTVDSTRSEQDSTVQGRETGQDVLDFARNRNRPNGGNPGSENTGHSADFSRPGNTGGNFTFNSTTKNTTGKVCKHSGCVRLSMAKM